MKNVRTPERGFLVSVGVDPEILVRFQFNPAELAEKRTANYATLTAPGMLMPLRQYTHGGERTLSFTVLVDGVHRGRDEAIGIARDARGGIGPELAKYRAFGYPRTPRWRDSVTAPNGFAALYDDAELIFAAPPACRFGFGERVIDCVVTEVNVTEKLFTPELDPIRAEIAITLVATTPYEPHAGVGGRA